jgi:hypothetical protein
VYLPIKKVVNAYGANGHEYQIVIEVSESRNLDKYPEGVQSNFRMLKIKEGSVELVALIDNHKPYGFHYHDKLPEQHDSRVQIHTDSWQEAWVKFQEICKEILNEL